MNLVDLLLALVVLLSIWGGYRRGLLCAGADVVILVVSLLLALLVYPHAVSLAEGLGMQSSVWTPPLAFLLTYLLARILLGLVLAGLLKDVPQAAHTNRANRALGTIPGAANGLINGTIVSMLLVALPLSDGISSAVNDSVLANHFAAPAEWLEARLRPIFDPAFRRTLTKLTVQPGSKESIKLPFTVETTKPRPDLEAAMLDLVNEERQAQGLKPLKPDAEATEVARAHSRDMFARGYFSHITPDGNDPFERMRAGGIRFLAAGENLALARTLPMAHQGLMDSPGHRANILRPQFARVGIGIVDGGRYGLMVTQNFRN